MRSMLGLLKTLVKPRTGLSRRELFHHGGILSLAGLLPARSATAAPDPTAGLQVGAEIYQSIGVRPLINCRGTLTIVGGSLELPEVRAAKDAAAQHYAQLDELMEGVGKRVAALTGAEWGIVTSGCAAALAHATAACVAGGNPDLHVRIPNLAGFEKDEVIIPKHSRNVYDAAVREIGVRIIEVNTREELEAAIGPRTAMIYVFATQRSETGPLAFDIVSQVAKQHNVPILVDAAAEILTIPNVHLQRGATMVGYSGGKCLRGPQCAGILLGRKDLVQAAWVHSAPHHGYGRSNKVGKEEILGMLMAVEMWVKRDHDAEWNRWVSWMDHIAQRVTQVPGVSATVRREPGGLSNRSAGLRIAWDSAKLGITGEEAARILWDTEPRIALGGGGGGGRGGDSPPGTDTGIGITAYMMQPGDEKIAAERIYQVLSSARPKPAEPLRAPDNVSGRWQVDIQFAANRSTHTLYLQQQGSQVQGTHQGNFVAREMSGRVNGDDVFLSSSETERVAGNSLQFRFTGKVSGETMAGTLDMGEYLGATWTAKRDPFEQA
jgi:L-seryl-tRNA(Ser) seleniumtransferase